LQIELELDSPKPATYEILWMVNYGTQKYGQSFIHDRRIVRFRDPFFVEVLCFDSNFQPVRLNPEFVDPGKQSQPAVNGGAIYVETTLHNNISFPLIIKTVETTLNATFSEDLPINLCEGEQLTFIGTPAVDAQQSLTVVCSIGSKEDCRFSYVYDALRIEKINVRAVLHAPGTVVRHIPFVASLTLENVTDELILIALECVLSRGFLCEGPGKQILPVFGGQLRTIDFTFVAWRTGSVMLPTITIVEQGFGGSVEHIQTIQLPVIVVHN
jgi:hypothetical protein